MIQTLFPAYVKKYFAGIVAKLVEKTNGKEGEPTYYFKSWFTKKYDPTLKYESLLASSFISAADVVATDSVLPLKMRDSISSASGEIPKIGMKMQLREGEMNNIDIMLAQNVTGGLSTRIITALFGDVKKCIQGVYSRLEWMALQALSTGQVAITNSNNVGLTDVITFGIPAFNQNGATTVWSNVAAVPLTDLESIVEDGRSKGYALRVVFMDRTTFNNMRKTTQVKERYGAYLNLAGTNLITPTLEKVNTMLQEDLGLTISIVESYVNIEKNGVRTNVACWDAGKVVLLQSPNAGSLYYGITAEERRPVAGVTYQKADDYMLISKFAQNEPLAEFTAVQAYVIPVLEEVDAIFQLNTTNTSW